MDATRFSGQTVMITGGGSGIGRATAHRFAQEGAARLVLIDKNEEAAATVAEEVGGLPGPATASVIVADLSVGDACRAAVTKAAETCGQLDIVISNAAAWTDEPFLEMQVESWNRVVDVNLHASFHVGQSAARIMSEAGGGVILFTSSIVSQGGCRGYVHYNATKAGIASLVQTMAIELAVHGIRVNCISPGPTDTPQSVAVAGEELMEKFRREFPWAPLNRLGLPEDMAAAFAYLASSDAAYVTGHNLVVDGGLLADVYSVAELASE